MERTVRGSILQSERNDHFRACSNTLQEPITRSLYLPWFSWIDPLPSRFKNRTVCFPRKVSYFRESRMSPWKNIVGRSLNQKPALRPFSFFTMLQRMESRYHEIKVNELPGSAWKDGAIGENWGSLKGYLCEWFWFLTSYIPHVSMHFEKSRRLNVLWTIWNCTTVSAEKVPVSLDFCHHRGALV